MQFSASSVIQFGWETFKKRPWFFIGAAAVLVLLYAVAGAITGGVNAAFGGSSGDETLAGKLVSYALGVLISMGAAAFFLAAHDRPETVELAALWHPQPFLKYLGTSLLATLAVGIGLLLFIVPGLVAMVLFMFSPFLVIDRELGPIEALKESVRVTEGNRWPLLGFVLLLMLIVLAGTLALGVGLLVAIPVVSLAMVHAYRLMSGGAAQVAPTDARLNN